MRQQAPAHAPTDTSLKILIVCEHASAKFGGEAILPLHYFRVLRDRGHKVWLVAHERTRDELTALFPNESRIRFIEETPLHRMLWKAGKGLPAQVSYFTTGFASRLSVQLAQRKIVRDIVATEGVDIIHQPTPVSPREPSMIYGLGAPVIVGPMNGGMDFPPAFRGRRTRLEGAMLRFGRMLAAQLNRFMPGKRQAAMLLVANARTRAALPDGLCKRVEELVENGVELDLWRSAPDQPQQRAAQDPVRFAFLGRLISLKAVDLLIDAFAIAAKQAPMQLVVIGDGDEGARLREQAAQLFLPQPGSEPPVRFAGWLPQTACAEELARVDCLVMPSLRDCGGAVVLEAMAMSMPVIATAWGGPLDYLDDSCGILVEPTDRQALVDGLAQAMLRLARSPLEREEMGRAARRKIETEYDWEIKIDRILDLYRLALQESRPALAGTQRSNGNGG